MGGLGAGLFASGLLGGIGEGLVKRRERQDRFKLMASEAALDRIASLTKDPSFTHDPQAVSDINSAYFSVLADITGKKGKGGKNDPVAHAQQLTGELMSKIYPSGQPELKPNEKTGELEAQTAPRPGPFYTPSEIQDKQRQAEEQKKAVDEQSYIRRQQAVLSMKQVAKDAEDKKRREMFEELQKPSPDGKPGYPVEIAAEIAGYKGVRQPTEHAATPVKIELTDGRTVDGWENRYTRQFTDLSGAPIPPQSVKSVNPKATKENATEQAHDLAFQSYAEKHGKKPADLTAPEKVTALREYAAAVRPPKQEGQGGGRAAQKEADRKSNAKAIADAIIAGTDAPDLSRMYGMAGDVRAELDRKGYDLARAQLDYKATTSWISSQNSQAQLRIRQATEFAFESLDLIDDLNKNLSTKLGSTRSQLYPRWNKAAMTAAKEGFLGKESQQAANNLEIQIADLQAEIATVYKGGNSPTDIGLKKAQEILSGNWTYDTLRSAVELARKNLKYRINSIRNTGVAGATTGNRYMQGRTQAPEDVLEPKSESPVKSAKDLKAGQRVKLRSGQVVTVTKVNPDGTFDYK